ncbi:T9SS type A sorting domain-containing protein [Pedobacter sp. MW01-1-1]|uniref:T9SS type A sorting domain-containing protein n=1 Tax=Pedobacter sp. MW01-1-1 TaxID=3383027 RepID=UPI003FF1441F
MFKILRLKSSRTFFLKSLVIFCVLILFGDQSYAATKYWKGTTSTAWNTAANWQGGVPAVNDDVVIGDDYYTGNYAPIFPAGSTLTIKSLTFGSSVSVRFTVNGALTVTNNVLQQSNNESILSSNNFNASILGSGSLTVNGNLTVGQSGLTPKSNRNTIFTSDISILTVYENLQLNSLEVSDDFWGIPYQFFNQASLVVSSGMMNLSGQMIFDKDDPDNTSTLTVSLGAQLNLLKDNTSAILVRTGSTGTTTLNFNGIVDYKGTAGQDIITGTSNPAVSYATLKIENTSAGFVNLKAATTVTTLLEVTSSSTLNLTASTLTLNGANVTNAGTIKEASASTFLFTGSVVQSYSGAGSTSLSNVKLNKTSLNYPLNFSSSLTVATSLDIQNANSNLILDGNTVTLSGANITNTGKLTESISAATLLFTGSTAQTFSGTGTATLSNLTLNKVAKANTLTLSSTLTLTNALTPTLGTLAVSTGTFTLESTEAKTAYVTTINTSNAAVNGTVYVRRFMKGGSNARRGYRLMSSPTHIASSPNFYNVFNLKQNMYITGSPDASSMALSSATDVNKFDYSPYHNSVILHYKESNAGARTNADFVGISLPLDRNEFTVGEGMYVFNRGLRTDIPTRFSTSLVVEDNTLAFKGDLNQGTVTVNLSYTVSSPINANDGLNLIGNPYASTIDLTSPGVVYAASVSPMIYVVDPATKTFSIFNRSTGIGALNASRYISSGQGFFVQAMATGQTITFNESAKVSNQLTAGSSLLMGLEGVGQKSKLQYMKLLMKSQADTNEVNQIVIDFHEDAKDTYQEIEDGVDMGTNGNTLLSSLSKDNIKLAYNTWSVISKDTRVRLAANSAVSGTFDFVASELATLAKKYNPLLIDHYKNETVKFAEKPTYTFTIDRNLPQSYVDGRFEIAFEEKPLMTNTVLNFYARPALNAVNLGWNVNAHPQAVLFTVERSCDGLNFSPVSSCKCTDKEVYSALDSSPNIGDNYYRLVQTDINDQTSFSESVLVKFDKSMINTQSAHKIYPNPVVNKLNVDVNNTYSGEMKVRIIDTFGQVLKQEIFNQNSFSLDVNNFSPGTYILEIVNNSLVIARSKFLKK